MKSVLGIRNIILTVVLSALLIGCDSNEEMSQEEIEYLSHVDQAHFFQRQGELKASTIEARSAIELQPDRAEPYLIIINNLLTAGDAVNSKRQLDQLMERMDLSEISQQSLNDAALLQAEANFMQGEFEESLKALGKIEGPDRAQQTEAALLRAQTLLASGNLPAAREAYESARDLAPSSADPLVGLSKVAFEEENHEKVTDFIEQAKDVDPQNAELALWRARIAHNEGRWEAAEQAYITALETIGQYDVMTYRKFDTMSALIDVLRQQGKAAEAFVYEEILAKSAPGTIRSNLIAAQEAFNDGDLTTAARYLEETLTQAPSHEQAALMLGIIRFRQGRAEDAEELLAPIAALGESEQAQKLLAATRLQMRNPEGAKEVLANIKDQDSDPGTLALVGIVSLASGDKESGEQLIEKSLELNPDNNELRLRYANYHIRQGEPERAVTLAQTAIEKEPSSTAWQVLINAQIANNDLSSATEAASNWLKQEPDNAYALIIRGNLALRSGNHETAREFYERGASADPESPIPFVALGNLELAQESKTQAMDLYSKALKLDPNNREALERLSQLLTREDLAQFMMELQKTNPDAIGPRLVLLETALINGNRSKADELTADLIARENPDTPAPAETLVARIYSGVASQFAERQRTEEAETILERGRVLFPENDTIGLQAAALMFSLDKATEAREILSEVKQSQPDSPSPFIVEGQYFERLQDYKQAAELFQLALEKDPQNPSLMMSLATLYQADNQLDEAAVIYEILINIQPENSIALNNLAWILQQQGSEEAMELAEKAYQLSPQNPAILDTYGWILFNRGQQNESLALLEKAHELSPESQEIKDHLLQVYRALGKDAKARELIQNVEE